MNRVSAALTMLLMGLLLAGPAVANDTVYYYSSDTVHSEVVITDAGRNVVERTNYAPYGQVLNRALRDGSGYTGHEEDPESGMVYMQQRYYDPQSGRFVSSDPIATTDDGDSFNRYAYVGNDPYGRTDQNGECFEDGCVLEGSAALLAYAVCTALCPQAAQGIKNAAESIYDRLHNEAGPTEDAPEPASSPRIEPSDLQGKTQGEIEQTAKDKGLVQDSKRPNKYRDPVTGKERIRIDPGHVDKTTGKPFNNPNAAQPHVHGYDPDGQKIRDPATGDPHIPLKPADQPDQQSPCENSSGCN
jgi:RHS repeat-associated protein